MDDLVEKFQELTKDYDDDQIFNFLIASCAAFCEAFSENQAEAFYMLVEMHHCTADLIAFGDEETEVLH